MNRPPFMGRPRFSPSMGFQPVGKMTNSSDPGAKASRVFVGNLNTGVVKEADLVDIFQKYGPITGVSLIKGFGFVQFTNEFHANKAVQGEHGHVIADQPMDLRIAADPNPTRPKGFKRVNQSIGYNPYVDPSTLVLQPSAGGGGNESSQTKKMRFQNNTRVGQDMRSGDAPQYFSPNPNNFVGMGPNPGMGYHQQISKMTNSPDPKARAARVFLGNLNTGYVKEADLVEIFQRYGPIVSISLIKGFGFVQYTNEFHARKAVQGEHGRVIADQPMDLRIADDPNPTRPKGFKRVTQNHGYQPYVDPEILPVQAAAADSSPQSKRMKFQAKTNMGGEKISGDEPTSWVCAFCKKTSTSSWELMKHASMSHQTQIYVANPEFDE